jgi:phage terminase large subunit-like protein
VATAQTPRQFSARNTAKPQQPAGPFTLDHFRDWALRHELDTDEPWVLEVFEERFAVDVFAGVPICWLVVPEGNGKTTFVGGLSLYIIEHKPSAYVPVAASARDQAEWIYRQAEGLVYRSGRRNDFKCLEGYRRIRCDAMGSRIQVFAADDRSGDGIIPGGICVLDELHRHRDLSLYETWKGKLRKRNAQLVVISTAGEVGGEFEQERERLRQSASEAVVDGCFTRAVSRFGEKPLSVLHEYALPAGADIDDLDLVNEANPASYVTRESLEEKRAMVKNDQHWSRFTCNLATRGVSAAVTEAEWFAARSGEEIPEGEPVWLGLDLGWKYDTTAMVPLWMRDDGFRLFGPATILTPPRDSSNMDPRLVEDALRVLHERNPFAFVVMDMTNGEQLASWIEEEFNCQVVDRNQHIPMQVLDYTRFMEALREGWLRHTGDPGLTRHVLNATSRVLPSGDIVFARPSESRHGRKTVQETREIDALVAAAMAHTSAASPGGSWIGWGPVREPEPVAA